MLRSSWHSSSDSFSISLEINRLECSFRLANSFCPVSVSVMICRRLSSDDGALVIKPFFLKRLSILLRYPSSILIFSLIFFCGAAFNMSYFIKHPPFRKREGTIQKVLVKQANDICIEPIEAPYLVDYFAFTSHINMIPKLLDKVK